MYCTSVPPYKMAKLKKPDFAPFLKLKLHYSFNYA